MTQILAPLVKPLASAWARRRTRAMPPQDPTATLRFLLQKARHTRFGREFGFADVLASSNPLSAFRAALPIMDYDVWVTWLGDRGPLSEKGPQPLTDEAWPGTIDIFCLSSGTTSGRTKYIPYSTDMAAINRRAALDFFAFLVYERPEQAPLLSQTLYMSGSTNLARNANGALCGDMSALTKYLAPRFLDMLTQPPPAVASLEPWERRLEAMVELCLDDHPIGAVSGIPIWQLTMLERIIECSGKPISQAMPHLRYLIHGGMSISPYRERIQQLLGDQVQSIEVYAASEIGIGAYQIPGTAGMHFWQHYQVFYEFEDDRGRVFTAEELQPDTPYGLLVSSCSGLWRYRIGDRLTFASIDPLILAAVGRDKTTSAFDEKVTEQELEAAMIKMPHPFADFSLGPDIEKRRHVWFLIGDSFPGDDWVAQLDRNLREQNQDYDDYRGDGRIQPPAAVLVPKRGEFLNNLGRAEGGQRKFPRLLSPDEVKRLLDDSGQPAH